MGIYIYSLRSKTVSITLDTGEVVKANLYSYAYRMSHVDRFDGKYYTQYQFTVNNTERRAQAAFGKPRSGYVVIGDADKLDGCSVYKDVTAPVWYDCDKFPGTLVGFVKEDGKRRKVTDRTEWCKVQFGRPEGWVDGYTRSRLVDGVVVQDSVEAPAQPFA